MEKQKVPYDDAKMYEHVVIGPHATSFDLAIEEKSKSTQETYKEFYPDTKMVKIEADHDLPDKEIDDIIKSFDEGLGKNMQRLRVEVVLRRFVLIFASAEFKKVVEKMKCRCVVEYYNPSSPDAEVPLHFIDSEQGVYYRGGLPWVDVESSEPIEIDESPFYEYPISRELAIYWRPYEEK